MPKTQPRTFPAPAPALSAAADDGAAESPTAALRRIADALYRSARECCRQRERYSQLVHIGATDAEEEAALEMVGVSDSLLLGVLADYESAAAHRPNGADAEWWRCANTLWLASREYQRRHEGNETATRRMRGHDSSKLAELATGFDLEASALLAMCHALEGYRRARPEAAIPTQRASAA